MAATQSHQDLVAWQEAMRLVEMIYRCTEKFPRREIFGLSAQLRRSAVSIPSNIAEGAGRNSPTELFQYLGVANGSLAEVQTQLEIAVRLGYLRTGTECLQQASRVGRLLIGLRPSVGARLT